VGRELGERVRYVSIGKYGVESGSGSESDIESECKHRNLLEKMIERRKKL
jgi:hypothetical protein